MKTEHKRKLIRLIDQERIQFHNPEDIRSGNHQQVFSAVRELGGYRFQQYSHSFTYEAHQKPWRARIKRQVERIVRLAEDCHRARQNEFGWRLKLESEILARFTTEVTCKRCSSKLWRSEVEVLLNPSDTFGDLLDLEQRQANRKPCTCNELQRYRDRDDPGICRIFHDRADEPVKYGEDDPIAGVLPAEQKPDRVYGYRKTSRFVQLLDQEISLPQFEGQELRDVLECSPFNELRDQVLFPFLVLEAKCESGDSFDDVETQTAFAIKKLLDIQFKLKSATGERSQWLSGPLVWFLSNRGDDWRVAAAFVEEQGAELHYHVSQLWTGGIRSKDAALQLLLIIDYIFDWARDSQREAILNELRIFAGRNVGSISDDSDIRSLEDRMQPFLDADSEQRLMDNRLDPQDLCPQQESAYRWLDSDHCVVRSISRAHARVSALYITKENLKVLLLSFSSNQVAQKHARDLLRLFREAWKVSPDALEALEFIWTGNQREDPDLYGTDQTFCAVFTVAAYFLSDWEHVAELTYIAIAEDVLEDLKGFVDLQQPIHVYPSELPTVRQEHLVGYLRYFRQSSPRAKLLAAMRRSCLSSRLAREKHFPNSFFLISEDRFDRGVRYRLDVTMLPDRNPKSRQLVAAVYNQCKKGMREPEESFLRMSSTFDITPQDDFDIPSVWGFDDCPIQDGALYTSLVCSEGVYNAMKSLCVYVLDDVPGPRAFPLRLDHLESFFKPQRSQHRDSSSSKIEWNITFDVEPNSSTSVLSKVLQAQFPDLMVRSKNELISGTMIGGTSKRSAYHATRELPPHIRSNTKTPQGHFVAVATSSNPYEEIRDAADVLVARKHHVKLITCLYTRSQVAGRAGLRSETGKSRPITSREEDLEELRNTRMEDFTITSIIQRGDSFCVGPQPSLKRSRSGEPHEEHQVVDVVAGDWLTDKEMTDSIRAGNFSADLLSSQALLSSAIGSRSDTTARGPENARKRLQLEGSYTSAEGSTSRVKPRQESGAEEVQVGDHLTDKELEAFLEAGVFGQT